MHSDRLGGAAMIASYVGVMLNEAKHLLFRDL
jgi:hypothetical protein